MLGNWTERVVAWLNHRGFRPAKPRRGRRRFDVSRRGAMIEHLEVLESRRMLTSIIAVNVSGGAVALNDASGRHATGEDFSVTYTSTQVVLTGMNGTMFQVGNQLLSTYTATVTSPISLGINLGRQGNAVTITGDGTTDLAALSVDLGNGRQNSLTLTKVISDSINIAGGRRQDTVVMDHTTVNTNLNADLGRTRRWGDSLDLETTTVTGNMSDRTNQLVMNHSTVGGTLTDVQLGKNSSIQSTASTYTGAVSIEMGRKSTINLVASTDGPNNFKSDVTVTGRRHSPITANIEPGAVTFAVPPTLKNVNVNGSPITAPTVNSQINAVNAPTITGTFDSVNTPNLSVNVNGKTYVLGTDPQLTSPSTGTWSLDLTNAPLGTGTTPYSFPVTVTATTDKGFKETATGTVSNNQAAINAFLTANNLKATTTADGLNYVITTPGTGAIPKNGQTVTVNYTGHLLNADGTLGTTFDSNTDPSFGHVSPFSFTLGAGQVIKGWDEAFALLPVGTVAKLLIPSALAYGAGGKGNIPPNAILEFDVTLVSAA